MFTVTQKVENKTDKPVTLFPYGLISRHGLPHTDGLYILHEGPLGVFRDKAGDSGTLKDFSYKDIVSDKAVEFSSIGGWLGFTDNYWLAALIPGDQQDVKARIRQTQPKDDVEPFQAAYPGCGHHLEPGKTDNRKSGGWGK